jgi:hypothetical protein
MRANALEGGFGSFGVARANFDKYQHVVLAGDDVYFAIPAAPVGGDDGITLPFQIADS